MPTTIAYPVVARRADEGLADFACALLAFYSALALVLVSIAAIEIQFGMYPGLSAVEAIFEASGIGTFSGEFAQFLI